MLSGFMLTCRSGSPGYKWQIWKVGSSVLSNQSWRAEKGLSSNFGFARGHNFLTVKHMLYRDHMDELFGNMKGELHLEGRAKQEADIKRQYILEK